VNAAYALIQLAMPMQYHYLLDPVLLSELFINCASRLSMRRDISSTAFKLLSVLLYMTICELVTRDDTDSLRISHSRHQKACWIMCSATPPAVSIALCEHPLRTVSVRIQVSGRSAGLESRCREPTLDLSLLVSLSDGILKGNEFREKVVCADTYRLVHGIWHYFDLAGNKRRDWRR
jgi:hypothetical protein